MTRWTSAAIEQELRAYLAGKTEWPAVDQWKADGRSALLTAVYKSGGPEFWADQLDVTLPRRGARRQWTDEKIERKLREYLADATEWPAIKQWIADGQTALYYAAIRNGGALHWADVLGLSTRRIRGVTSEQRVETDLRAYLTGKTEWPTPAQWAADGQTTLLGRVHATGGVQYWAPKMGLSALQSQRTDAELERQLREYLHGKNRLAQAGAVARRRTRRAAGRRASTRRRGAVGGPGRRSGCVVQPLV